MSDDNENTYKPPATQEEFDQRIGARLAHERSKFADHDELKAKAAKYDEAEAKNASELEKAQKATTDEKARADKVEADLKQERRDNALIKAASGKVVDPDAAARLIDPDKIEYDDAGYPTNAGTLVDALVKEKAYLKPAKNAPRERPRPRTPDPANNGDGETNDEAEQKDAPGKARANEALQRWVETR